MTTDELVELLKQYPGIPVNVETETMICPIFSTDVDVFDIEEGAVFLITPDMAGEDPC